MTGIAIGHAAWLATAMAMAGACTGALAGLFGVGGGTIIVPVLYEVFGFYGVPDEIRMQMCVGTSLAIIIPTSIASFRDHFRRGTVDMPVLRAWFVPIVIGVGLGVLAASFAKPVVFKAVFAIVSLFLAIRLLAGKDSWRLGESLPGPAAMSVYGLAIGTSSSLMGIGGGLVANVVLSLYGRPIHKVVSTAAGVGLIVSIPGAFGYILAGWSNPSLPPFSLGYVSLVGFLLLTPLSLMTVRFGVSLAHRLEKRQLELALCAYLIFISLRFAETLL